MSGRESFEAHAKRRHLSLAYGDCGYVYSSTNEAWEAWQASREALKAEQGGDGFMCVPVADLYELLHKGGKAYSYTSSSSDAAYWVKEGYTVREYVKLERLQEAFDQPASDAWIACADRMPNEGDLVTVCDHGIDVYPAVFSSGEFYEYSDRIIIEESTRMSNPTHWMPLPAPPSYHSIDTTSQQYEALSKGESK